MKCGIPFEKVKKDAYDLIPFLNSLKENEPFTESDVNSALECYDSNYVTFPLQDISKLTAITIQHRKRNGRRLEAHIKMVNATRKFRRDVLNEDEYRNNGRKPKKDIVQQWRLEHPDGRKADCIRDTGLTKPTVYKWWDIKDNQ